MSAASFFELFLPVALGFSGVMGLVALLSPRLFSALATKSSSWVDSKRFFELLDRRIDIDEFVLARSRVFGALVLAASAVLAYLYVTFA